VKGNKEKEASGDSAKKAKADPKGRLAGAGAIAADEETPLVEADSLLLEGLEDMREEYNNDDLLSGIEIEASMQEVLWFDGEPDEGALQEAEEMDDLREMRREGKRQEAEAQQTVEDDTKRRRVNLPYATLECVFNDKNLWVSKDPDRQLDPAQLTYNFADEGYWLPFVDKRMQNEGLPKAFYTSAGQRLAAKVPADRLRNMENQILQEIRSQLNTIRATKANAPINRSDELVKTLERGLALYEDIEQGDEKKREDLGKWNRDLKGRLPPSSKFKGRAFNYAYTDPKRIRRHLLGAVDYAEESDEGLEFVVAVKAFPFHGGICTVWVYFGMIDTNLLN